MYTHAEKTNYVRDLVEDKCDPELGAKVCEHLTKLNLEMWQSDQYDPMMAKAVLEQAVENAITYMGLPIGDPSLSGTPKRFACMMVGELTKGLNYEFFPKCTCTPNGTSTEKPQPQYSAGYDGPRPIVHETTGAYNQMVVVANISTTSLCEHHWQTIDGVTHIAYIPSTKVLGLSKFARVTEFFARRPQIQERMTEQIFAALSFILKTPDVAVIQQATHFCMKARGTLQANTITTTNKMGGRFMTVPALREELMHAIGK